MKRRKAYFQESRIGKVYHLGCLVCSQCSKGFSEDDSPKLANDGKFFILMHFSHSFDGYSINYLLYLLYLYIRHHL